MINISSYIKIAFRGLKNERAFTRANIIGLTLGFTTCLLIFLWILDELKYNQFPAHKNYIAQAFVNVPEYNAGTETWETTPYILKETLELNYPQIRNVAAASWPKSTSFKNDNYSFDGTGIFGSPELFEIFSIPFIEGSNHLMYKNTSSIAISESFANKFFGNRMETKEIIGKILTSSENDHFEIIGVFKNVPRHSTLQFEYVIPYEYRIKKSPILRDWNQYSNKLFVRIEEGNNLEEVSNVISNAIGQWGSDPDDDSKLFLQGFTELYLFSNYENGQIKGGRIDNVILLSIAAGFILLLVSVNFINLSIVRLARKWNEIYVRRTFGSSKFSLRFRFGIESFIINISALFLSLILVICLLGWFNEISGKNIEYSSLISNILVLFGAFILFISVISFIYVSFSVLSLKITALNPGSSISGIGSLFRKSSLFFQNMITFLMIVSSLTVYYQMNYILNRSHGIDRNNIALIKFDDLNAKKISKLMKEKIQEIPGIRHAGVNTNPIDVRSKVSGIRWEGMEEGQSSNIYFGMFDTDHNFLKMMGIELKDGRNFDHKIFNDTLNYLVNEEAVKVMGFLDPIGKRIEGGRIIGVVRNFHFQSLHEPIIPLIIQYRKNTSKILIKAEEKSVDQTIPIVESLLKEVDSSVKLDFTFLDEEFRSQYKSETLVKDLILYFTFIAIVVSCFGQVSFISYKIQSKFKEIGIRKVLGSSNISIIAIILKELSIITISAIIVVIPLALFILNEWLLNFTYKINLHIGYFIISGLIAILITLFTIFFQAKKAAFSNPVDSIRQV